MRAWICETFRKTPAGLLLRASNVEGNRTVEVLIPNEQLAELRKLLGNEEK